MKAALISASPKFSNSASDKLIMGIKKSLNNIDLNEYYIRSKLTDTEKLISILKSDVIVLAFPLYVDGVPAHLLYHLEELIKLNKELNSHARVFAVCNSGFYESKQNRIAVDIIKNWTTRAGLEWGYGILVGGGGYISYTPNEYGEDMFTKDIYNAINKLAEDINQNNTFKENKEVTLRMPRLFYKMAAEGGWRKSAKSNGVSPKEL